MESPAAVHPENIDEAGFVFPDGFPFFGQHFNPSNSRYPEKLVAFLFGAVAPYLHVVGGECVGFHAAVAYVVAVRRSVIVQNDRAFVLHGLHQPFNVVSVFGVDDGFGQYVVVVHGVEFLLQILFDNVVLVDTLDGRFQNVGFLAAEVNQAADVFEVRR